MLLDQVQAPLLGGFRTATEAVSRNVSLRLQTWRWRQVISLVFLACVVLFTLAALMDSNSASHKEAIVDYLSLAPLIGQFVRPPAPKTPSRNVLRGVYNATTLDLDARLVPTEYYLTSGLEWGFTNQVMTIAHILHLASLSGRTPILPPFHPLDWHLGYPKGSGPHRPIPQLNFSDVFDLPYLFDVLSKPDPHSDRPTINGIVEWSELTDVESAVIMHPSRRAHIGCWKSDRPEDHRGHMNTLARLGLIPSYTSLPDEMRMLGAIPPQPVLSTLAEFIAPSNSLAVAEYLATGNVTVDEVPPTDQLSCFDFLYFASDDGKTEGWSQSPRDALGNPFGTWFNVGQHMRFRPELLDEAFALLREIFGVPEGEDIPDFVSLHIRHGDFFDMCPHRLPEGELNKYGKHPADPDKCAPTRMFAEGLDMVLDEIANSTVVPTSSESYPFVISKRPKHVFVATNAHDPAYLADIEARGWKTVTPAMVARLREEGTDWSPTLMDKVIMSLGRGFVGTMFSTMSEINARRVESWNYAPSAAYVGWHGVEIIKS